MKKSTLTLPPFVLSVVFGSVLLASSVSTAADIDPLLREANVPLSKASADFPGEFDGLFTAVAPGEEPGRSIASPKAAKKPTRTRAPARFKNRLPSSVSNGFEFRMRYGAQVSTFWVVKRSDRHDLLFANNSGSRASVQLSQDNFQILQKAAGDLKNQVSDFSKCKKGSVQVLVVAPGRAERTVGACITDAAKASNTETEYRTLGGVLSAFVR